MRTREQVTPQFLQEFILNIKKDVDKYKAYLNLLWIHRDEEIIEMLDKITQPPKDVTRPLRTYHELLASLQRCLNKKSQHPDHEIWKNLHKTLVAHLETQEEAEWLPPTEESSEHFRIASALNNLANHAMYRSKEEEKYCTKWNVASHELQDTTRCQLWDIMLKEQSWQIEANNVPEVSVAAKNILGLGPDNVSDCFVLQDKDAVTKDLEKEYDALVSELRKKNRAYDAKLKDARNKPRTIELIELEKEKADTNLFDNELIQDKMLEIQRHQIARLHAQDQETHKTSLNKLQDLYHQLSLWTPRNLTILFIELMVHAEVTSFQRQTMPLKDIAVQSDMYDDLSSDAESKSALEVQIERLGVAMYNILSHVKKVQERISDELQLLKSLTDNKQLNTQGLKPFADNHFPVDPEKDSKAFTTFAKDHLLTYTPEHFLLVQELLAQHKIFSSTNYHGIDLPLAKHIKNPLAELAELKKPRTPLAKPEPTTEPFEEKTGLRKSNRVFSGLHTQGRASEASEVKDSKNVSEISYSSDTSRAASPDPQKEDQEIAYSDTEEMHADQRQQQHSPDLDEAEESSSNDDENELLLNEHERPAATPAAPRFTVKKVLIGLAIGLGIALALAGIASAIIFSGGTAAAGMAVGATIASQLGTTGLTIVYTVIGAVSLLSGLLISAIFGNRTAPVVTTPAAIIAPQPRADSTRQTNEALNAHRRVVRSTSAPARLHKEIEMIEAARQPVKRDSMRLFNNQAISPPPSPEINVESQKKRAASAPSVYQH